MPSIDEECGSVISDEISNEEMLHHLNFHSTTIRKKEVKPWVLLGLLTQVLALKTVKIHFRTTG